MPFTMSYGEPQTPAVAEKPAAPKRKRAPATPAANAERAASRRDTLKDKAQALFEPGVAAPDTDAAAEGETPAADHTADHQA